MHPLPRLPAHSRFNEAAGSYPRKLATKQDGPAHATSQRFNEAAGSYPRKRARTNMADIFGRTLQWGRGKLPAETETQQLNASVSPVGFNEAAGSYPRKLSG